MPAKMKVAAMEQTAHGHRYVVDRAADRTRTVHALNVRNAHGILILVVVVYRVFVDRTPVAKTMSTIKELDAGGLTCDLPEHRLARGDVGTAVLVHGKGAAFEVEFVGYRRPYRCLADAGTRPSASASNERHSPCP